MRNLLLTSILLILTNSPLFGEFNRGTGYIDIPRADVLGANVVRLQTNGFLAMGTDSLSSADLDITLSYGLFDRAEIGFSMYETKSFAGFLSFKLLQEKGGSPGLSIGVQEISNQKWISSVGGGGGGDSVIGFPDDLSYWNGGTRNPERYSAYLVMTRKFSTRGSFSFGVGRGRFVGYGFRSRFFNTDLFIPQEELDESANLDAVGLFFGGDAKVAPGFFLLLDFDGRDLNAGVQYRRQDLSVGVAFTHLEQALGGGGSARYGSLNSRLALGLEWNTSSLMQKSQKGLIAGRVLNKVSQKPVAATITIPNTKYKSTKTNAAGRFTLKLDPGSYLVQVTANKYETRTWRINAKKGETTPFEVTLKKKEIPEVATAIRVGYEFYTKGNYGSAKSEWQKALQLDPGNDLAKQYMVMITKKIKEEIAVSRSSALKYTTARNFSRALAAWKKVLSLDPNHVEAKTAVSILNSQVSAQKRIVKKPTKKTTTKKKRNPKLLNPLPRKLKPFIRKG
jgi:tetratricopeptide (TPR) repeat protein